jgi:multidrug efflux pump
MSLSPPAIDELGTSGGFSMRLEDRAGQGYDALMAAQEKLLALAAKSKVVTFVYPEGLPAGTNVKLEIDREKAQALGVSFTSISDALSAAMGSAYVNDFPNKGRMQQVIVQAEASSRMQIGDLLRLNLRNADGGMVPLAEVVHPVWRVRCRWCATMAIRPCVSLAIRTWACPAVRPWRKWKSWPRSFPRAFR